MRHEDILKLLNQILLRFDYHPRMIQELLELIQGSGVEQKVLKLLLVRLNYLDINGLLSTKHEEFEPIEDGIFSMHLSQKDFNIRILYGFLPDKSPSLLLCFYERGGKRATDYSSYKKPAVDRLIERREAYNNAKHN